MTEPIIQLSDVGKRFGARLVLTQLNAQISAGSIVSLVGASGSGKTTLLRCLNGLTSIDTGSIRIASHLIEPNPTDHALTRLRSDVGLVLQDYQLFPHLSVLENLCLAPRIVRKRSRQEAEKRAYELLERVGLGDRGESRPSELSGGQKQRVALARALAQDARVLLLDEPTSALDRRTRDEIIELIRDLVKRARPSLTVVLVTHDVPLAEALSDEVWALVDGRLERPHGPEARESSS